MNNITELEALQSSFNEAIDAIRSEFHSLDLPELTTYASGPHVLDNPAFLGSSRLFEARRLALACIGQLKTLLQVPYEKVVEQSCAVYDTASFDIFIRAGILDKLLEPEHVSTGLSVSKLAIQLDLDPVKLVAIMRYLAVQGWVYEKEEDTFCLTRPAFELREGSNGRRWALTPGKPQVAMSLLRQMTHPEWKYSNSATETAFQLSHNTKLSLFEYLKQHPSELKQWASSVKAHGDAFQTGLLSDYPWKELDSSLIVDCGGGQGYLTMALAKLLKNSNFIIQDLPEVVTIAQANLEKEMPEALLSSRITAEPHNFFHLQPYRSAQTVYVFRYILHDWSDSDCVQILKNTVELNKKAKVLIIEYVGAPSTPQQANSNGQNITLNDLAALKRYKAITPPCFVPLNFGVNAKMSLALGVHMMGVFNARERSMSEWKEIINKAGLRINQVYALRANVSIIEC